MHKYFWKQNKSLKVNIQYFYLLNVNFYSEHLTFSCNLERLDPKTVTFATTWWHRNPSIEEQSCSRCTTWETVQELQVEEEEVHMFTESVALEPKQKFLRPLHRVPERRLLQALLWERQRWTEPAGTCVRVFAQVQNVPGSRTRPAAPHLAAEASPPVSLVHHLLTPLHTFWLSAEVYLSNCDRRLLQLWRVQIKSRKLAVMESNGW